MSLQKSEATKAKIHIVELSVDDEESSKKAAEHVKGLLGGKRLDYLINNAGIVSLAPLFCVQVKLTDLM